MNDRELLELAAKAAGIRLHVWGTKGAENFADMDAKPGNGWNPLEDDGDALRLAVRVPLLVINPCETTEETRRAIVLAAAEIGKRSNT